MKLIRVVLFLLAFSLVLQNTCPYGFAAKTAFATCGSTQHSSHCPMHEQKQSKQDGQNDVKKEFSQAKQIFVLSISQPDNSFQILSPAIKAVSQISNDFKDVFSEPPLRPPLTSYLS